MKLLGAGKIANLIHARFNFCFHKVNSQNKTKNLQEIMEKHQVLEEYSQ